MTDKEMDLFNRWMVGVNMDDIVIMMPPTRLTNDQALVFAAWIVALADPIGEKFKKTLDAICNT